MDYPSTLPCPLRAGYDISQENNIIRTSLGAGRPGQRVAYEYVPSYADLSFLFTAAEAQIFAAWMITAGCTWFNISIRTPLGYFPQECRFTATPSGPGLVGVDLWEYKASAEIRDRDIIDPGYGGYVPTFILYADIFDLAMNREWPI